MTTRERINTYLYWFCFVLAIAAVQNSALRHGVGWTERYLLSVVVGLFFGVGRAWVS